jgi:hypothetical protein
MTAEINAYLSQFDLDVRKSRDARFMDQKCTPDVVCFIADCVLNTVQPGQDFTTKDIWTSQYFVTNTQEIFTKPRPTDGRARHEYDKFIQQSLRMLGYAQILDFTKRGKINYFRVKNEGILYYISINERNAYNFLCCYFEKVLTDSGFWRCFEEYMGNPTKNAFNELKERYTRFIIGNTKINKNIEVWRIFPKILNVLAVKNQLPGSVDGYISKHVFTFSDLMYNRKNWRDMDKDKTVTRQEAGEDAADTPQRDARIAYCLQKAIKLVSKIQKESEVHDQWSNGEVTQVHHIFPKSQFPEIAHYVENLIKLTPTQHNAKAHPDNKTQEIDRNYQLTCLLAKADTIDKSLKRFGETYYRKESFVHVCNTGLSANIETSLTLKEIKSRLMEIYNNAG